MDENESASFKSDPTYGEALEAVGRARATSLHVTLQPDPTLEVDVDTQVRLLLAVAAMASIGRLPGDYTYDNFDRPINFRKLTGSTLDWLEQSGVAARRDFAPLACQHYAYLLGHRERLPVASADIGRFFSRLIHLLLIETQIIIAKQYYHGLGLYHPTKPEDHLAQMVREGLPAELALRFKQVSLNEVELDQLHGRVFLEYCAVMIRAQWDKLVRLICFVLGLSDDWESISKGLKSLDKRLSQTADIPPWCHHHLLVFYNTARERVADDGWLKKFRDPLLHDVGPHSAGVLPRANSVETTSEMWEKVCDEHDWFREGMMAVLVALLSFKQPSTSSTLGSN